MQNQNTNSSQSQLEVVDSGFFVLRTPLLPFNELLKWSDGLRSCAALGTGTDVDSFTREWENDVRMLRARLRELVDRAEIRQALFIASPSLEASLDNWKRNPENKKGIQTERSLIRYFSRMCARPTPFGIFAGHSTGRAVEGNDNIVLSLDSQNSYRLVCRLDFDYLFALTTALQSDSNISEALLYRPNSSLRSIGNVWHYVESRLAGSNRSHHLVKLYREPVLDAIIEKARDGLSIQSLVETITKAPETCEFPPEEVRDFISELVINGVLVSNLSPLVTGIPPLDDVINQLDRVPAAAKAVECLRDAKQRITALEERGLGSDPADYRRIASTLEQLPAKFDLSRLFQVDMVKLAPRLALSQQVLDELKAAITVLYQIGQLTEPKELQAFRDSFVERFERAWVPLEVVLDEESGIGFGSMSSSDSSPLLRNLGQLGKNSGRGTSTAEFQVQLKRALETAMPQSSVTEIVLDLSDILPDVRRPNLPSAFDVMATLVAPSVEAIRKGDFRIALKGLSGPSGARLLGRFCHVDQDLERHVRNHLQQEERGDPDAVYAEIVHLPEGRIGNVLCRPVLRGYEVVYLGRSGAPSGRQLPISDLLVTVVPSGRILLYSKRLGKRVIPRLSNAHGYFNAKLACIYRFLSILQHDGCALPSFSWGDLGSWHSLPRVRIGRVILAHAQWRLTRREVDVIAEKQPRERFLAMQELKRSRGFPRWVVLVESDNSLPVDLDNPLSVDAFIHVLKRAGQGILSEMYPSPEELCVSGPEGKFCHEIIVPFVSAQVNETVQRANTAATISIANHAISTRPPRSIPPGGEWIYTKIYSGPASLDEILANTVPTILRTALSSSLTLSWFFIRYGDPHLHLRIRFKVAPDRSAHEFLPILYSALNPLLLSGTIWKVQLDTYEREIERYGGPEAMAISEEIFSADSDSVLEILQSLEGDEGDDTRWRVALLAIDRLLKDFGFGVLERQAHVQKMRDGYEREFNVSNTDRKQLGEKFRRERDSIAAMFQDYDPNPAFAAARQAIERRSARLSISAQQLRAMADAGELKADIGELVSIYNHLHVNRLLRTEPRTHELVLYDFLYRLYDRELAMQQEKRKEEISLHKTVSLDVSAFD